MSGLLFFKQKTAYEMRISDWSADGCSSDLLAAGTGIGDEHSDDHLPAGLKPLHRIGDMAAAALFGAREDAVAHAERIPSPLLHHPYTRRRGARLPALGQIGRASCRARVCRYV